MKTKHFLIALVSLVVLSGCFRNIGDLNMISTRNVDSKTDYRLLVQYQSGKGNTLEDAVTNAVKQIPGGEYMRNVTVFARGDGYFKVIGDIWGTGDYQDNRLALKPGLTVLTSVPIDGLIEATVIRLDPSTVFIEYKDKKGKRRTYNQKYEKITIKK